MHQSVSSFAALLSGPAIDETAVGKAARKLIDAMSRAQRAERDQAIEILGPLVRHDNAIAAASATAVCGSLVEQGADPAPIVEPVAAQLIELLRRVECEAPAPATVPAPEEIPSATPVVQTRKSPGLLRTIFQMLIAAYKLRRERKRMQREHANRPVSDDERRRNALGSAAIAILSARPQLRSAQPELRALAAALRNQESSCHWLDVVFSVGEDEPILVLDPAAKIGMLARLSGVDLNFALHMLLMQHFPHSDGSRQSRLGEKASMVLSGGLQCSSEQVAGTWNLYQWPALKPDGSLPKGQSETETWIWNEGTPADIAKFDDRRVILLGPPAYCRTWPAQRTFAAMIPKLAEEKILSPEEVDEWIRRFIASPRPQPSA